MVLNSKNNIVAIIDTEGNMMKIGKGWTAGTCRNLFFLSVPFLPPKHSFLNLSHKNTSLSNLCRADGGVLFRKYRSPVLILIVILIVENTLQLIHEGIHILEFSVDRSKSHISDRIQIL